MSIHEEVVQMSDFLDNLKVISKSEFLDAWKREEEASGHLDEFMDKRIGEHRSYTELRYYIATLTERGLENLILGPHVHPKGDPKVPMGGKSFWGVVREYQTRIDNGQTDSCLKRLDNIVREISTVFKELKNLIDADYCLGNVYSGRDFSYLNLRATYNYRNYGKDKMYAGNFHRFVGYGLWILRFGYWPIKVRYCETADR